MPAPAGSADGSTRLTGRPVDEMAIVAAALALGGGGHKAALGSLRVVAAIAPPHHDICGFSEARSGSAPMPVRWAWVMLAVHSGRSRGWPQRQSLRNPDR